VLCALLAIAGKASLTASGAGADVATLKKIASRVNSRAGVIAIESSAPVAYVAAQPDPRMFVIELRDVVATGFANDFTADPRHPFSAIQVVNGQATDGTVVARVQMTLAQPLRPRVRSARNIIYVEADRLDHAARPAGALASAGPASAILHLNAARRGTATAVTLYGSGRLTASRVEVPEQGAPRLVINLTNATAAMTRTTAVGQGPVDKVHLELDEKSPLTTRVVMDLTRRVPYRIDSSPDGTELTVVFEESGSGIGDPGSAPSLAAPDPGSRIPDPGSLIPDPGSLVDGSGPGPSGGPGASGRAGTYTSAAGARCRWPAVHRFSNQPRFPGRGSARRTAHVRRDQRLEHRHRSDDPGHRRRGAA
jgi:hypothetical protein